MFAVGDRSLVDIVGEEVRTTFDRGIDLWIIHPALFADHNREVANQPSGIHWAVGWD